MESNTLRKVKERYLLLGGTGVGKCLGTACRLIKIRDRVTKLFVCEVTPFPINAIIEMPPAARQPGLQDIPAKDVLNDE